MCYIPHSKNSHVLRTVGSDEYKCVSFHILRIVSVDWHKCFTFHILIIGSDRH